MNNEKHTKTDNTSRRILLYLGITFLITYSLEIFVIAPTVKSVSLTTQALGKMLIGSMMFIPAIGVLLTRLLTKEGFKNSYIVPKTGKKSIPFFLFGWFGPVILSVIGAVVFYLVFPDRFDTGMSYMVSVYTAQGIAVTPALLKTSIVSQIAVALLLGPLLNFFTCFGEEWGWRGYLLPKMKEKCSMLPMLLINGIIWGLWHAPLTVLGHNYGTGYVGYPFTGILAMCLFCTVMGIIFSYITIRTGSCLPAVLAHGSLNGFASAALFFHTDKAAINPFLGPAPTGIIGGCAFLICAVIMAVLLCKSESSPKA